MEMNRFMLEFVSICPETTHQKLESQCVYLTLQTMNLYVKIRVKISEGVALYTCNYTVFFKKTM